MIKITKKSSWQLAKSAFTLAELLIAILICSIILVVLAPVITQRKIEQFQVANTPKHFTEIIYGSTNCNTIDEATNSCKGEFQVPSGTNSLYVTVVGAGGGGGGGTTSGSIEYKTPGTYEFIVPYGVNEIEATLVGGGAGGGAGNVSTSPKAISWTHSATLNRTYVTTAYVPSNLEQRGVSTTSVYTNANAVLSANDIKYLFAKTAMVTISGGGGGGGRGFYGSGGGGGAARHQTVLFNKTGNYNIRVARGGKGHSCNDVAGCGGGASYIKDPSNNIIIGAGGGGGGCWGIQMNSGTSGDSAGTLNPGGSACNLYGAGGCADSEGSFSLPTGGYAALPGGSNAPNVSCRGHRRTAPGGNGAASTFGKAGVYNGARNGQGYGAGGCGGGACPDCHGHGAPGFVAITYYETQNGGGGGGSGSIVPRQRYKVTPGEKITVIVGEGGKGGTSASLSSAFAFSEPKSAEFGKPSMLKRGSSIIVMTNNQNDCSYGACGGKYSGDAGNSGYIFKGGSSEGNFNISSLGYSQSVFYTGGAQYAGGTTDKPSSYQKTMRGGNGAKTIIEGESYCSGGTGASLTSSANINAQGYGGCGGGGGYGTVAGGNGAGGYVKITWNPDKIGRGGGGSAGLALKKLVNIPGGNTKIGVQIGRGGSGGYITWGSSPEVAAQSGGDTIFGTYSGQANLRVGGGLGGKNASYSNGSVLNGIGGISPTLCAFGNLTNLDCIDGNVGYDATSTLSGAGAASTYGSGGFSVEFGDGNSALSNSAGGSGGGVVINATTTTAPSRGGSGGPGKIIVEW